MHTYDLQHLPWTLTGWTPFEWRLSRSGDMTTSRDALIHTLPAQVPGSVQQALFEAGLLPDWNVGVQARACEWVEHRHWVFATRLPAHWFAGGNQFRLRAYGLDYSGWIFVNGQEVASFANTFTPYVFDISAQVIAQTDDVALQIIFDCPPSWLGQFGYTSKMTCWKPRFNYTWDWMPRLVQIGIWDDLFLEAGNGDEIEHFRCLTLVDGVDTKERERGSQRILQFSGAIKARGESRIQITLASIKEDHTRSTEEIIRQEWYTPAQVAAGIIWHSLPVELWWPNGAGNQPLYQVEVRLYNNQNVLIDSLTRQVGFKSVTWESCQGAPAGADPWLCVINGQPTFLQGVNWTPIRPNFADTKMEDYELRLRTYRDMGCNLLRVWGGAYLEKEWFYHLCDQFGLLVWQEFPLSSSGVENRPPEDPASSEALCMIAESFVARRQHHVSLLMWGGGNELQEWPGNGRPISAESSPLIARLQRLTAATNPGHRFVPSSPSGPRFTAEEVEMGLGVHWDVHGPWMANGDLAEGWTSYWRQNDALFHSEVGVPGASSVTIITSYAGQEAVLPVHWDNPLWLRTGWWIEYARFVEEKGHDPETLDEYVQWSQQRQAMALAIAARFCKSRFPRCGGFLVWMGHDGFPCTSNTSLLDFHGNPKLVMQHVSDIFHTNAVVLANNKEMQP